MNRFSRVANRAITNSRRLGAIALALASLAGCTIFNRPIVYEDAKETAPLQVPNDLRAPVPNPALQIPDVDGLAAAPDTAPPSLGNTVAVARAGLPRAANAVLDVDVKYDWRILTNRAAERFLALQRALETR